MRYRCAIRPRLLLLRAQLTTEASSHILLLRPLATLPLHIFTTEAHYDFLNDLDDVEEEGHDGKGAAVLQGAATEDHEIVWVFI